MIVDEPDHTDQRFAERFYREQGWPEGIISLASEEIRRLLALAHHEGRRAARDPLVERKDIRDRITVLKQHVGEAGRLLSQAERAVIKAFFVGDV